MEKTINIGGKNIKFKCTGGTMMRYRNQFNSEFLIDLEKLSKNTNDNIEKLSLQPIEQIIWALAKTADDTIPEPLIWLDSFESFPIVDIYKDLQDMIFNSLKISRKNV